MSYHNQQSWSTFGCILSMINGKDRVLDMCFSKMNSQYRVFDWFSRRSTVNIVFWFGFDQDQHKYQHLNVFWPRSTVKILFWMVMTTINGQHPLWLRFDQEQRSRTSFGYVLTAINSEDPLLDTYWPRSTVKIRCWICYDNDQWSRSTFVCVLIKNILKSIFTVDRGQNTFQSRSWPLIVVKTLPNIDLHRWLRSKHLLK